MDPENKDSARLLLRRVGALWDDQGMMRHLVGDADVETLMVALHAVRGSLSGDQWRDILDSIQDAQWEEGSNG